MNNKKLFIEILKLYIIKHDKNYYKLNYSKPYKLVAFIQNILHVGWYDYYYHKYIHIIIALWCRHKLFIKSVKIFFSFVYCKYKQLFQFNNYLFL
mgnify:CR=1 FL=1